VSERVALFSPYALSVFGGVQEQALAMSRELSRRGYEVLLLAPDGRDKNRYDTPAQLERFGRLWSLPANGSRAPITLSPLAARRAHQAVRKFRPDVVHFHEPFAPLFGWDTLRSHDAAAVATFHRSGDGPALALTGPLLRYLARNLDGSAAVSEAAASTIGNAAGLKTEVLFNGLEMERFEESPRERSRDTTLLYIGRLEERKGVHHAIAAVMAHNARGADQWRLVVLGDGPQRAHLEDLAKRDLMILFVGSVNDADKRAWLRRAHVLVAPSIRGESFGLILLEAMASETAVVASDIAGYREAVGGCGLLFLPGDHAALETAISTALVSETSETIAAAKAHAEHWSMRRLIDRYEVLYARARQRFQAAK
jgi:phosphatidylinositol alpha-mannosyltransferase